MLASTSGRISSSAHAGELEVNQLPSVQPHRNYPKQALLSGTAHKPRSPAGGVPPISSVPVRSPQTKRTRRPSERASLIASTRPPRRRTTTKPRLANRAPRGAAPPHAIRPPHARVCPATPAARHESERGLARGEPPRECPLRAATGQRITKPCPSTSVAVRG